MFCVHVCLCPMCVLGDVEDQNRAAYTELEYDVCELTCGGMEPNLSPLQTYILLTVELSLLLHTLLI